MSYTIGVDFHKRTSTYHVLGPDGEKVVRKRLENDPFKMIEFLSSLPPGHKKMAMEATRNWGLFYETTKDFVDDFALGHPKKMKAITHSETKNDFNDAEIIARLTASGFLPKAHISSLETRELRSLVRFRGFLVNQRRSIKNQIQTLIDRNIWPCERPKSFKDPFCKTGLKWLATVELPERERTILDQCLKAYDNLCTQIAEIEAALTLQESSLSGLAYLRTVPGFKTSKVNALVVLVETSDITRFNKARAFARYAGLIPKENSSGDKHRTGRLIKSANMHLRTALIESTLAAIRTDKGLRQYYDQVKERRGSGPAIIATARKLSYAIYHVLKEQRAYTPEPLPPAADCHPNAAVRDNEQ